MGRVGRRIPDWIKFRIPSGQTYSRVRDLLQSEKLNTICLEARCPNMGECFCSGTATFLILGKICTRNCRYCSVSKGHPAPPDEDEPDRIAGAVARLGLRFAVITSVTRDDLPDGGAGHFTAVIGSLRRQVPGIGIEVLIPDFLGKGMEGLDRIIEAAPDIINHNIEVARPLYGELRPRGDYRRSLEVLARVSLAGVPAKSGLMIGFGETLGDILSTLADLRESGCSRLTVGQYLQSDSDGFPVRKFYTPEEFEGIREAALGLGFAHVLAGPLVRSSYHAGKMLA